MEFRKTCDECYRFVEYLPDARRFYCAECGTKVRATPEEVMREEREEITGKQCGECHNVAFLDNVYDAYFCKNCDKWLESQCEDPECHFCVTRPASPSQRNFHI